MNTFPVMWECDGNALQFWHTIWKWRNARCFLSPLAAFLQLYQCGGGVLPRGESSLCFWCEPAVTGSWLPESVTCHELIHSRAGLCFLYPTSALVSRIHLLQEHCMDFFLFRIKIILKKKKTVHFFSKLSNTEKVAKIIICGVGLPRNFQFNILCP